MYSVYFSCCRDHDYGANNLVGHHGLLSGCLVHEGGSERVRVVRDDGAGAAHLKIKSTMTMMMTMTETTMVVVIQKMPLCVAMAVL